MVIKDLVEKAKISVPSGLTPDEWIDRYNEILVGLVVLECVNAVMDSTKEGDHYAMRIEQHFDKSPGGILHFGVE